MTKPVRHYTSDALDVTYDAQRCIHAAECVRGLPAVFNPQQRPWIQLDAADADSITQVVLRCPTGALHVVRKDGGADEPLPEHNRISIVVDGPLYLHGRLHICAADGTTLLEDTRVALCRCGMSTNKPFCDNTHTHVKFTDDGQIGDHNLAAFTEEGELTITLSPNGPILLSAPFELHSADGNTILYGQKAALCRCGGSQRKPFCDGTHQQQGFQG